MPKGVDFFAGAGGCLTAGLTGCFGAAMKFGALNLIGPVSEEVRVK